ncbi:MAG: phosphoribosyltransferase family protein, partial [Clostridia bacterium]
APFATRLFCAIACPAEIEFVQASSYGSSDKSGDFTLKKDTDCNVSGRDVIIVDDILDTGKTLLNIREMMVARGAASVKLCVLFNKPSRREAPIEADFVGLTVPDEFLVGFGLDFAERYRNLPYVGVLKPSIYAGNQI